MKLTSKLNPKNLFNKSHKSRSNSSHSFNSSITTSSNSPDSSHHHKSNGAKTPTTVLPISSRSKSSSSDSSNDVVTIVLPHEITSDSDGDVQFELLHAFNLLDTDKDGRITRSELESLLSRLGGTGTGSGGIETISRDEIRLMINEMDRDCDGSISLEEFSVIKSAFGPPSCDGEIKDVFEFFDTDGDGMITAGELLKVFEMIGDGECTLDDCRRMISVVDKNGDGVVCFEDFASMMEQQR